MSGVALGLGECACCGLRVRRRRVEWRHVGPVCCRCSSQAKMHVAERINPCDIRARTAVRHHALKYVRKGVCADAGEFRARFGWHVPRVRALLLQGIGMECPDCAHPMERAGRYSVSVDVIRADELPHFATNVRVVCRACNSAKRNTPANEWADEETERMQWRAWFERGGKRRIAELADGRMTPSGQEWLL